MNIKALLLPIIAFVIMSVAVLYKFTRCENKGNSKSFSLDSIGIKVDVTEFNCGSWGQSYVSIADSLGEFMRFEPCMVAIRPRHNNGFEIVSPCIPISARSHLSSIHFIHAENIAAFSGNSTVILYK